MYQWYDKNSYKWVIIMFFTCLWNTYFVVCLCNSSMWQVEYRENHDSLFWVTLLPAHIFNINTAYQPKPSAIDYLIKMYCYKTIIILFYKRT